MIQASLVLSEAAGNAGMPIGIHKKVMFTGMTVDSGWLDINFSNAERQTIRKRLFKPSGTMLLEIGKEGEKVTETPEQALERERSRNLGAISGVLKAVLEEADFLSFSAKDYDDFIAKAEKSLNKLKGAFVNLKVVGKLVTNKESKKKTLFPDIQNYPGFIEKFVEGQEPTLTYSKKELEVIEGEKPKEEIDPFK